MSARRSDGSRSPGSGRPRLEATDLLCLAYHAAFFFLLATAGPAGRLQEWRGWAVAHLLSIAAIGALVTRGSPSPAVALLRRWYPVLSLLWLYSEVGALRHLLLPGDLDPFIARLDAALFRGEPHRTLPGLLPEWALEALHGVYASYYLLLFVPGLVAMRRESESVRRYIAVLNAAMLAHFVVGILLPVAGPLALRAEVMPRGELFIPMMDALYAAFDRGGMAFPSTHVAAALIAAAFAGRWFPRARPLFYALAATIAFSTVACCYHYTIDVLAGAATGLVALALAGAGAPRRAGRPSTRSSERRSARSPR